MAPFFATVWLTAFFLYVIWVFIYGLWILITDCRSSGCFTGNQVEEVFKPGDWVYYVEGYVLGGGFREPPRYFDHIGIDKYTGKSYDRYLWKFYPIETV